MTAEIAILNKSAVALAADSAITYGNTKIYNSGNKLFALSKYRPVGIMVFGNAEFMGVPWETIIKLYRLKLKDKKFDTLKEYAEDLMRFLENENPHLWSSEIQNNYFKDIIKAFFQAILKENEKQVKAHLEDHTLTIEQSQVILSEIIDGNHQAWDSYPDLYPDSQEFRGRIVAEYGDLIEQSKSIFQDLPITESSSQKLTQTCLFIFSKENFLDNHTGVVIAGFGENEIFPSTIEYIVESVVLGRLKKKFANFNQASREQNAIIMAFAQKEMVNTFVEGIDPDYKRCLTAYFQQILSNYSEIILNNIPEVSEARRQDVLGRLKNVVNELIRDYVLQSSQYTQANHIDPVLMAVNALPKDELAAMAESLVNLTSFKRKISLQKETVGGPIDVAVISKGDGFIWIKRKHYFKPEQNQVFFSNYYRDEPLEVELRENEE